MTPEPPPGQGPMDPMAGGKPQPAPPRPPGPMGPGPMGPPPGMYPPFPMMPFPPYPPPRPHGGFARGIFRSLALMIFSISLLLNVWLLGEKMLSGAKGHVDITQTPMTSTGDPKQKIAVLRLEGIILDSTKDKFFKLIDAVEEDTDVQALVLEIDSPGGAVTPSDEIYDRLMKLKEHRKIKIVVSMSSLAASGGYYIACAADKIVAQRTSWTGSIGVILPRYDLSEGAKKIGIADDSIVADGAILKNSFSPIRPLTEEERVYAHGLVNDAYETFKKVVSDSRGSRLKASMSDIATGQVFTGDQALKKGLVDQLGYLDDAVAIAAADAGLKNPQVVRYEREVTIFDALTGNSCANVEGASSSVPGVDLQFGEMKVRVDAQMLNDMVRPRAMYLWSGH